MTEVILKSAEYTDFRGIKHEILNFDPVENTILMPNKAGKTTRATGYSWVLYGKDTEGNTRFDVESNNVEDPKTNVLLTFYVDGKELKVGKSPGKWNYDGHEVKKNVFDQMLSNIQSVEILELLSNPFSFMSLHWETRRNYLTKMFSEKVPESSEFSFFMNSMSISDIRKSKSQAKKVANDGLIRSGIIIETYEKGIKEIFDIDFLSLKKELEDKTKEIEKINSFDWSNYNKKLYAFEESKKEYAKMVSEYKTKDAEIKTMSSETYENSKGCSKCGAKVTKEKFEELKQSSLKLARTKLENLQNDIIAKREPNAVIKKAFDSLEVSKPNETTVTILKALNEGIRSLGTEIAKENQIVLLNEKITKERVILDGHTSDLMAIESFMDRFNDFLSESYYKSINDNFEGLFFDIEDECKLTNAEGTEFKYFSLSEKINAGVQIVSVLSKKLNVKVPIWIDNRESVTDLFPIDTQVINLKVKE